MRAGTPRRVRAPGRLRAALRRSPERGKPAPLRLAQDVRDALEGGGEGFEIGAGAQAADALQARLQIHQIAPAAAGGHARVDFVVGEAADVLEVVAHALGEEGLERLVVADEVDADRESKRPSIRMRTTPCAARRSANGSREPVGIMPTPKQPRSVSSLSASATICAGAVARDRVLHALRLVVIVDRLPDRLRSRPARARRGRRPRPAVR